MQPVTASSTRQARGLANSPCIRRPASASAANHTRLAEAAPIAARAWRQFDEPRYLIQALTLYASRNQWSEIGALLRELDPAPNASRRAQIGRAHV